MRARQDHQRNIRGSVASTAHHRRSGTVRKAPGQRKDLMLEHALLRGPDTNTSTSG